MSENSDVPAKWPTQRHAEIFSDKKGRFNTEWRLTDTKQYDVVKITLPPSMALPILFIPGIMGSNLSDQKGRPVWLLNSVKNVPAGLAFGWAGKTAGMRQLILHPERTRVFRDGAVPKEKSVFGFGGDEYIKRGWGEVSEASYHSFLLWLERKMNNGRNPSDWEDFHSSSEEPQTGAKKQTRGKLEAGLKMGMQGLPTFSEGKLPVEPIKSDELLKRAKFFFPVYAYGYNWLESNDAAAERLKERVEKIIKENNVGSSSCKQVILITHSMGGLVARACVGLPNISEKIAGVIHGVMPTVGAAVAYRRCKVGMADEDYIAGKIIGSDGRQITAVFAQAPGALQLLPSEDYGKGWLEIDDPVTGNRTILPKSDPYEEIYLQRDKWWGLVKDEWLKPLGGKPISWENFVLNIQYAKEFHRNISKSFHKNICFLWWRLRQEKFFEDSMDCKKRSAAKPWGLLIFEGSDSES